jgi:lathosterol oxidase
MDLLPALLAAMFSTTAIVGLRYLASSGLFAWLTRRRLPGLYRGRERQIRREIGWSLPSAAIYGAPAGLASWAWGQRGLTLIYSSLHDYPIWWWPPSILAYLLAHDTWFYWTHRWMHRPAPFRIAHAVHHASRPPTAWAAMSFHPVEALTGALVVPVLVFLIPIHYGALLAVFTIMTVMGVSNHMGWEMFPRWIVEGRAGAWLITASHHHRHHQRYGCNYGLYFRFWDRLCRTDDGLGRFEHHMVAGGDADGGDRSRAGGRARRRA